VTRLLCALAFAVHPAVTEAVAWISSIGELQMTTCVLLAMLGYLKWRASGRNAWLVATALLALGGVMIKDGALAFVPLVLALDWCRERTVRWRALAVIGSGTVLYLLWRMLVVGSVAGGKQLNVALDRLVVFAAAHLRYLVIPGQQPFSIAPPEVPVAGMGSLALTFLLVGLIVGWGWRQRPAVQGLLLFGGVWIVITLWPAYAIALVENGFFAGRHCYLPAVGWAIILATVLAELTNRVRALPAILAGGVLLLAGFSFGAAASWRTDIAVYERSTQLSPNDEGPLAGLADALFTAGDTGRAMTAYQQLAARTPNLQARNTYRYRLAIMSSEKGEYGQSNGYLNEILRQAPDNAAAWTGLGNNAWLAGQEAMAINHYRQALKLEPGNQEAQRNLATLLNRAGQNPP
jgi:hypothetical protein